MARIEHTIEVNVPLQMAYNQWTQFEEFPRFMEGVREVKQLDDVRLHWRAHRSGHEVEWDSEITDQVPDQHIAWRDLSGPGNTGVVNFYPVDESKTRVRLVMESHPNVAPSEAAMAELVTTQRIEQDLARFKRLLEAQGGESGAWRGEIHFSQPEVGSGSDSALRDSTGNPGTIRQSTHMDNTPAGQSVFAQQTSPVPPETPSAAALDPSGRAEPDRQTQGDADPRTATLNDEIGTAGLGANSAGGGIHGAPGSRTDEAVRQQGDASDNREEDERQPGRRNGGQTWIPNILQGLDDPLAVMRKMGEEMDQLFERFVGRPMANRAGQGGMSGKWMPSIEILQHENHLHINAELPGVKKEDVHIEILHDKLSIEGQRHEHHYQAAQGYKRSERSYGRFYRMIPLPQGVDPESVKAAMNDGVLEIKVPLPMPSAQKGRRIDIDATNTAKGGGAPEF